MSNSFSNRLRGCLMGLAAGDALGTTLEFQQPGTFKPIDDMIGGGVFHLKPGEWTDDTSMALCLAQSLIDKKNFDPVDQLTKYVRWWRNGYMSSKDNCFDIGITVSNALQQFEQTHAPYCGSTDPGAAGNGSLMRLAPVPMFYAKNPKEAMEKAADSSRTTHATRACLDACKYMSGLMVGALHGVSKEELLSERYSPVPGYWNEHPLIAEIDEIARGSFKEKQPPLIVGSGYVVKSLEAALWAFYHGKSFREGALLAVNLGNDADTTGAIYGQLAGAYYGERDIPQNWLNRLARFELLSGICNQMVKWVNG